ncbi:Hypothetical_protein [Hexamita inflata]|uniref:Hypothetical_protein n=1 Tax=Hexamita inflata TaxID=28002 RepID=A0AA86U2F1_9EUKA|nr:Hypothetical protein HINF_LOCUS27195 [Hexamita inflata]
MNLTNFPNFSSFNSQQSCTHWYTLQGHLPTCSFLLDSTRYCLKRTVQPTYMFLQLQTQSSEIIKVAKAYKIYLQKMLELFNMCDMNASRQWIQVFHQDSTTLRSYSNIQNVFNERYQGQDLSEDCFQQTQLLIAQSFHSVSLNTI